MLTMQSDALTANKIHQILNNTLSTIDEGKNRIFDIAESVRKECEIVNSKLVLLRTKIETVIIELDILEKAEKNARLELMRVSRNFKEYQEADIRNAYENANNFRMNLVLKRQEEKELFFRRNELEIRYRNLSRTLNRADELGSKICTAIDYLNGNLEDIIGSIEDMDRKKYYGIKVIKSQERERKKIAREIHDGPAQSMANIVLKAELCEKMIDIDTQRAKGELRELKSVVRGCLTEVRQIIYDLRPMSLDDLGLIPTVEKFTKRFSSETGIDVKLRVFGDKEDITSVVKLSVYRVIQESLYNVNKHANAKNVCVSIEFINGNLVVSIEDDGVGFNAQKVSDFDNINSGFGILGMKERVELLEGTLKVDSTLQKGTTVKISVPYLGEDELVDG